MTGKKTVWVYKHDGTLQCQDGKGIPLEEMQKNLEAIGATVLNAEKREHGYMIIQKCDELTNNVNAYEISKADWKKIREGVVGQLGFELWIWGDETQDGSIPFPRMTPVPELTTSVANPVLVRELIGRPLRVSTGSSFGTTDYVQNRVNIHTDDEGKITKIWFG